MARGGVTTRRAGRMDAATLDATSEDDVCRHMVEDGMDPERPFAGLRQVASPADVRRRTGLSQDRFAKALGIPTATLRNWEQGRTRPDPVALAFFALVADDPQRAFRVLGVLDKP